MKLQKNVVIIRSRAINPGTYKIASTLAKNGFNVHVVLWNRNPDNKTLIVKDKTYNVIFFNLRAPYDKITAILLFPVWWIYEFIILMFKREVYIIHIIDFDSLLPAIFVKFFKKKVKIVYSIQDIYAENLPRHIPNFIKNAIKFLEKISFKYCDAVFIVNPLMYYNYYRAFPIKRLKVIYNSPPCIEEIGIYPEKITYNYKPVLTVFYAGLIHRSRGLIELLTALKNVDNVKLIIAGKGPDIKIFSKIADDLKGKIEYIGIIPYEEVIKKTLEVDAIVAFYDPQISNNRYASPNKLFEAMMCSKPIIINKETFAANIVEKARCGLVVPYGDVNSLINALIKLRDNPSLRMELGRNGRNVYEKIFAWKKMEQKIIQIYRELTDTLADCKRLS